MVPASLILPVYPLSQFFSINCLCKQMLCCCITISQILFVFFFPPQVKYCVLIVKVLLEDLLFLDRIFVNPGIKKVKTLKFLVFLCDVFLFLYLLLLLVTTYSAPWIIISFPMLLFQPTEDMSDDFMFPMSTRLSYAAGADSDVDIPQPRDDLDVSPMRKQRLVRSSSDPSINTHENIPGISQYPSPPTYKNQRVCTSVFFFFLLRNWFYKKYFILCIGKFLLYFFFQIWFVDI